MYPTSCMDMLTSSTAVPISNRLHEMADLCLSSAVMSRSSTPTTNPGLEAIDETAGPSSPSCSEGSSPIIESQPLGVGCFQATIFERSTSLAHSSTTPLSRSSTSNTLPVSQNSHGSSKHSSKRARKTAYLKAVAKTRSDRETKIRELKARALQIKSTGKTPATEHQRLVMLMVFNEITPYPDEGWLAQLAVLIDR